MRMIDRAARAAFDNRNIALFSETRDILWKREGWRWIEQQRAAVEALMEPSRFVLQAVHDGPLGADDHHMDEKTEAWLTEMHRATFQALLDESEHQK